MSRQTGQVSSGQDRQDRTAHIRDRLGKLSAGQDRSAQDRQNRSSQVGTGQTGQLRSGQIRTGQLGPTEVSSKQDRTGELSP